MLVQERLKADPFGGQLFVFRGKRGDLIKLIWHDGQGMCLFAKRLERGRFIWPATAGRGGDDQCRTAWLPSGGYRLAGAAAHAAA